MAIADVVINFFRKKTFTVGTITLDALISETHLRNTVSTEYPVEDGAKISDNIILEPKRLRITGFVTNSPVQLLAPLFPVKVSETFTLLEELYENKELFSVVTNFKVYDNMVIESLNIPKDPNTGQSLEFTMTLKEIITVQTVTTTVPIENLGGDPEVEGLQAQPDLDVGQQTANQQVDSDSILQQLATDAGEIFPGFGDFLQEEGLGL